MPRISSKKLLEVCLAAADQGSLDCDEHDLNAREIGLLNEQWTQSYVGDAISRYLRGFYAGDANRPFVTYETSVSWLEYFFDQKRSPGPIRGKLSEKQRFDLTVWSKSGKAMGLIEIKNEPIMSTYSKTNDPKKLVGALRRWDDLKWGIFLYCIRNNTSKVGEALKDHLRRRSFSVFEHVESNFKKTARLSYEASSVLVDDDGQSLWAGVIFKRS